MTSWKCLQLLLVFLRAGTVTCEAVNCYTYNYEDFLFCSWNSSTADSGTTDVTVKWSLISGSLMSSWLDCPVQSQNSCRWDIERGDLDPNCVIRLCVSLFNNCYEVHCQQKVKPAPVQNVSLVGTTPSCVTLQWSYGRGYLWSVLYPQLYQITCLAISSEGQQHPSDNSTWIVNSTRFEVCGLLPYTKYLIKVAAIPQEGGIWSESRSITASTDKTVPGLPPYVHINSFTIISRGNGAYSGLMIFWREIQKQRIYGSHLRYVVSVCPYNTSQEPRDCTEETVFNFARFQIPAQQEITTRIWSKNEIGTSRDFALIRIPSKDELLQSPDILVVVSGSLTTVFLDIAQQKDVRFTVFWCQKEDFRNLRWLDNLRNTTITINHSHSVSLKYGVSVNRGERTSGIKWADCIFQNGELPGLLEMTLTHTEEDHLEVTWRIPSCNMRLVSAVVDHYALSFCSTSDCMTKRNFNISPEVTSYSYHLSNEDTLCAEINVLTLAGEKLQNGRIQCYTTGKKSSLYPIIIFAAVCASIFILCLIITTVLRLWRTNIEIEVPPVGSEQNQKLLNATPSTSSGQEKLYVQIDTDHCTNIRGRTDPKEIPEVKDEEVNQSISKKPSSSECCDSYIVMDGLDLGMSKDQS